MKRVRDNTQKAVKSPKTNALRCGDFFLSFSAPKQAENARVCFDETHELIREQRQRRQRRRRPKKSKKKKKHKSNKLTKKETARDSSKMKADPATGCSRQKKAKENTRQSRRAENAELCEKKGKNFMRIE